MEQAVPGQLSLEAGEEVEEQEGLQWTASSSSSLSRHVPLDYSEEDSSMEAEVQQSFSQYPGPGSSATFSASSPQPSSSVSLVSSRGALVSADQSLADMLAAGAGPSSAPSRSVAMSQPGASRSSDVNTTVTAKRTRSFPDSPNIPENVKRARLYINDDRPDSPGGFGRPDNTTGTHRDRSGEDNIIVLEGPSMSDPTPASMASQINREIENCLRDNVSVSRSSSIDSMPGPSRGHHHHHQPPRASFGNVASSVGYLNHSNGPEPSNVNIINFGNVDLEVAPGPPSPTGSEVLAAGPSRANDDVNINIELHDSPSGSEVSAAGPSQPASVPDNNPDSPAPSESDADEAGPSNPHMRGGYMVRFGAGGGDEDEREAAPIGRSASPVNRAQSRRNLSDSCLISSSTGPVDSNPPTPEMFGVSGDIDHEYSPSPPMRRYNYRLEDNDDAVVDSTVDSTNIPFVINDYEGNEVSHMGDDSDEDTENESVAGSEASSTTSARMIDDHRLSLPGQDDNEGISTSGQVDVGQFRLVPNDIELSFDGRYHQDPVPAPAAPFPVPDIQEIILEDNQNNQEQQLQQQDSSSRGNVATFKKPFNRKERIMEIVNIDLEPVAGPSGVQRPPPVDNNRSDNSEQRQDSKPRSNILYPEDYTNNLRIGLAFSRLPSSVTLSKSSSGDNVGDQKEPADENRPPVDDLLSGPLTKRLKTRHYQEQAKASKESNAHNSEHVSLDDGTPAAENLSRQMNNSEILRSSLERKPSTSEHSSSASVDAAPAGQSNDLQQDDSDSGADHDQPNNLGGVQQNFSVTLETSNVYLSSLKPKRSMQTKSAGELKEYLPLDTTLNTNDDDDDLESLDSFLHRDHSLDFESSSFITPKKKPLQESVPEQADPVPTEAPPSQITITISDQPVQSRAVASLPSSYLALRPAADGTSASAVFAVRSIPESCRFGPMEGRLVDPGQNIDRSVSLALIIQGQRLDVSSEEDSNWMRFIRTATSPDNQNLVLNEIEGQLYFTSTREINANEELRVWYSEEYAKKHTLPSVPIEQNGNSLPSVPPRKRIFISPTVGQNIAEKTRKESDGPNFTCDICQRKFERHASLLRHLALHKGDKNYTCDKCGQKFSHTFNLERHKKKVHNTDPAGQHVCCNVCSVWFPSSMVLKVHMFSHHPNKEEQNWTVEDAMAQSGKSPSDQNHEEMKFQCPSEGCECQYDTWLQLVEHAMDHGSPFLPSLDPHAPNAAPVQKCELCYKTFATEARLKKHMAVHAGDENKPLECTDCGKRFLTNSALAGHIKTHAHPDTMYDCPICSQEFEQVSSLKDHVYVHKINGAFKCPHCEKSFNEYPQIRKHIRAFHAEKRFSCTICDKSFTGKDKLKVHMVRHSEIKDFSCDDCGKEFKRKDKLREHVKRMHKPKENEKPEVDDPEASCSKFVPKVSPTELHRFIYKCQTCMLGFKRRGMLVNHLAKRHPTVSPSSVPELNLPILKTTKDFYCQYCDKVYKSSSKRKSHIIKNHPGAPLPAGARESNSGNADASTFSQTVGSVTCQSHNCDLCHKQYASKAKLLQHMRKEHRDQAGPSTSTKGERPKEVLYLNPPSPMSREEMMEDVDCPEAMDNSINLAHDDLFNGYASDFILDDEQGISRGNSNSNSHSLDMSELESQTSRKESGEGNKKANDQQELVEPNNPIIRVVGDQEFILLQPGPGPSSSDQPLNYQESRNHPSDLSLPFQAGLMGAAETDQSQARARESNS